MRKLGILAVVLLAALTLAACSESSSTDDDGSGTITGSSTETGTGPSEEETDTSASVAFLEPHDGATVQSPVEVKMIAANFTIEPAGSVLENSGHLHIMVDTGCLPEGQVIPSDDNHLHYGLGQTDAELELEPGEHTLCLQAADGVHTAFDLTDEITITVAEPAE